MCLTPINREVLTAEEDIPVFKILLVTERGYYSPIYRMRWEEGETKTVPHFSGKDLNGKLHFGKLRNISFTDRMPLFVDLVFQGLHSFRQLPVWVSEADHNVFHMTIPKGTKYIIGENGDVVSLALRFGKATGVTYIASTYISNGAI